MCRKMEIKKNTKESIPKTNMPDLSKTYGNQKKNSREQMQHKKINIFK